ncbi:MAG: hypothetical protein OSB03_05970, partial [Vicinamibacterales bacterium]|nr:hypothetical protein [Vicinamibacterales bacterium]
MSTVIEDKTILRAPAYSVHHVGADVVALDPARPHWIGTDERGMTLLGRFDGRTPFAQVVRDHARESGLDVTRALDGIAREIAPALRGHDVTD